MGQKLPNPWGLYDMHGHVSEWCQDRWAYSLPGGIVVDPQGRGTSFARIIRGGCWNGDALFCRSTANGPPFPLSCLSRWLACRAEPE